VIIFFVCTCLTVEVSQYSGNCIFYMPLDSELSNIWLHILCVVKSCRSRYAGISGSEI